MYAMTSYKLHLEVSLGIFVAFVLSIFYRALNLFLSKGDEGYNSRIHGGNQAG